MTEPRWDSTGEPLNDAAREQERRKQAGREVQAAQREVAHLVPTDDDLPADSWRARLRDFEAENTTMVWDGVEWEIPAKMPNSYYDAMQAGNGRAMIESILGVDGMVKLRIPRDIDAETLVELAGEISDAAGRVWSVPNPSRSARRSRSTTRR